MKDPIVLTTGTFNIVHAGHINLFNYCSKLGKVIVGINNDNYLKHKYKSKAISLENRLSVLYSLKQIDEIYVFDEPNPSNLIKNIKPDIYVKGPDYLNVKIPEEIILKQLNIKYLVCNEEKIISTSNIIF